MTVASDAVRIPLLTVEEMSEDQRTIYDAAVGGRRKRMVGPLLAALHSPQLARSWSDLGEFLRFDTCLPSHLNELAIIVAGRRWTSQVEWWVHARQGVEAGLDPTVVEAIRDRTPPSFVDEASLEIYEFARLLLMHGKVPTPVHDAVRNRWGVRGVVELTAVVGYYTMVALTLNAHQIPVPDPHVPLPPADAPVDLPAGYLTGDARAHPDRTIPPNSTDMRTDMTAQWNHLQRLAVTIEGNVATVAMNAPPVNAQDRLFREEFIRTFDILGASPDVRAIVLTGSGRAFSAGADLSERAGIAAEPGGFARHNRLVRASFDCITECPKPVIAAVNGAAIGAGCVMALLCDIVLVAEEAFIAMTEVEYGLAGGVRHMLRAFSPSDAGLIIYTARRVYGPELHRMNGASMCVPAAELLASAKGIAGDIAAKAPLAVTAAKRSFGLTEEMPLREGYRYEQSQTAALADTEDTKEALAAFREKRPPVFKGR